MLKELCLTPDSSCRTIPCSVKMVHKKILYHTLPIFLINFWPQNDVNLMIKLLLCNSCFWVKRLHVKLLIAWQRVTLVVELRIFFPIS